MDCFAGVVTTTVGDEVVALLTVTEFESVGTTVVRFVTNGGVSKALLVGA